ncbi:hypothetical protein IAU59_007638 [Kwoniella sp. CBS 9459]
MMPLPSLSRGSEGTARFDAIPTPEANTPVTQLGSLAFALGGHTVEAEASLKSTSNVAYVRDDGDDLPPTTHKSASDFLGNFYGTVIVANMEQLDRLVNRPTDSPCINHGSSEADEPNDDGYIWKIEESHTTDPQQVDRPMPLQQSLPLAVTLGPRRRKGSVWTVYSLPIRSPATCADGEPKFVIKLCLGRDHEARDEILNEATILSKLALDCSFSNIFVARGPRPSCTFDSEAGLPSSAQGGIRAIVPAFYGLFGCVTNGKAVWGMVMEDRGTPLRRLSLPESYK